MTAWRALDGAELRSVADQLIRAGRLLGTASAHPAAKELGWTVLDIIPHAVATVDPGFGVGDAGASLTLDGDDRLNGILVDVSESTMDGSAESKAFQQDVFARSAQTLTEAYGAPTTRLPGESPELWWRRETVTLKLRIGWLSVDMELVRNEDLDQETP